MILFQHRRGPVQMERFPAKFAGNEPLTLFRPRTGSAGRASIGTQSRERDVHHNCSTSAKVLVLCKAAETGMV